VLAASLSLLIAGSVGCTVVAETTPYPGECAPLHPVTWSPAGNANDAPTNTLVSVGFDDYPDPDTVDSDGLMLTTAVYWIPGAYHVDLVDRVVTFQPWSNLIGESGYMVHVNPALRSLGGCPALEVQRQFRTGQSRTARPAPEVPTLADVQAIFTSHCAGGCHAAEPPDAAPCLDHPAGGVSLCPDEAWAAVVDVASRQQAGARIVKPNDAARSYLVRKLLPPAPTGAVAPAFGHRGEGVTAAELRTLAAWIDGGAPR
jgi:hypothetical protein